MTAIFLAIMTLGIVTLLGVNQSVSKFLPNNRLKYAAVTGYLFLLVGLIGLTVYHTEFLSTPSLHIALEANLPDLLRAIAELLWPVAAILGVFWFLPQVLDFFNDPRKSVPLVQAFSGRYSAQEQQHFSETVDIDTIPLHEELSDAHKELIEGYKSHLGKFPQEQEKSRLLILAADCELKAIFENVYNLIFGSQIQALQTLETNQNIDLIPFYELHCKRTEDTKDLRLKSFSIWTHLLKESGLVAEASGKYSLSSRGKLFLQFLKNKNYYLDKAF